MRPRRRWYRVDLAREHVNSLACEFTYRFDHYRLTSSSRPAILSPQHIVIRLPNVTCLLRLRCCARAQLKCHRR